MKKEYELKCYKGEYPRILVSQELVKKNKFKLSRTPEEIIERIENAGMFDFAIDVLVDYLSWNNSKKLYKDEFIKDVESGKKNKPKKITDVYETVQDMLDYLIFGYMKSMDEIGLSASRTVNKLGHWLWLLGRDDLRRIVEDNDLYNPYGMPALIELSKKLGLKVPEDCVEFSKHKCS